MSYKAEPQRIKLSRDMISLPLFGVSPHLWNPLKTMAYWPQFGKDCNEVDKGLPRNVFVLTLATTLYLFSNKLDTFQAICSHRFSFDV
jgi:hypothetical protein